ncbi:hypothetical protein UlMin_009325 [Ulmus minor]
MEIRMLERNLTSSSLNLPACSPPVLPNCSHCPWDCKLIKNPTWILRDCGSVHHHAFRQGCRVDLLEFLDNFLKLGIELKWDKVEDSCFSNYRARQTNNGVCGFNSSDPKKQFICFCSKSCFSPPWFAGENPNQIAILCIVFAITCFLVFVLVALAIFQSRRLKSSATIEDPTTLFLYRHRHRSAKASTNRFDPKLKIGDGKFGSVYLGHLPNGQLVAMKYLHKNNQMATDAGKSFFAKSFCNEILILSSINHPNLRAFLVYNYVPNGTLADYLHGPKSLYRKSSLTWQIRIDIALQTAMVMEYLHFKVVPLLCFFYLLHYSSLKHP